MIKIFSNAPGNKLLTHEVKYKTPGDLERSKIQDKKYNKLSLQLSNELETLESRIGSKNVSKRSLHEILMNLVGRIRSINVSGFEDRIYEINKRIMNMKEF